METHLRGITPAPRAGEATPARPRPPIRRPGRGGIRKEAHPPAPVDGAAPPHFPARRNEARRANRAPLISHTRSARAIPIEARRALYSTSSALPEGAEARARSAHPRRAPFSQWWAVLEDRPTRPRRTPHAARPARRN